MMHFQGRSVCFRIDSCLRLCYWIADFISREMSSFTPCTRHCPLFCLLMGTQFTMHIAGIETASGLYACDLLMGRGPFLYFLETFFPFVGVVHKNTLLVFLLLLPLSPFLSPLPSLSHLHLNSSISLNHLSHPLPHTRIRLRLASPTRFHPPQALRARQAEGSRTAI